MSRTNLRQTTTLFTAAMLLVQGVASSSIACSCGPEIAKTNSPCCQSEPVNSSCCSRTKSCCATEDCGCGDSNSLSKCNCGPGDEHESQPYTPVEQTERSGTLVEMSLQAVHLTTDAVGLYPEQRLVEVTTPHPQSASHSTQSILCIWQA